MPVFRCAPIHAIYWNALPFLQHRNTKYLVFRVQSSCKSRSLPGMPKGPCARVQAILQNLDPSCFWIPSCFRIRFRILEVISPGHHLALPLAFADTPIICIGCSWSGGKLALGAQVGHGHVLRFSLGPLDQAHSLLVTPLPIFRGDRAIWEFTHCCKS